ncbi:hypothetical protein HG535_0B06790 [Zygotorulaspora mrakii]|uniref:GATA-type domain-containing protein n=1 Tax=Zygotorulaspora mrakii TaxID=42260 RepID=A0A7H9AZI1_ZYGMR|nr:uncharacterized protein HG535_0B06790 [Zygotorulaspora mrakii]QLG71633.1 hypothetical protein HG535_0B06790 [Zygotorulaspora mrakii]
MLSTVANEYSIKYNPSIPTSAGPDFRNKKSFDDLLLLPSLKFNNYMNKNYVCISSDDSPRLPRIQYDKDFQKKYNTAPASPTHHDFYGNHAVTPLNSPSLGKAQLVSPLQKSGLREYRQFQPRYPRVSQESLPSLRHLQLLPDPRIQESAYVYPDTSECTPIWKSNLVHWCKETNYQDYTRILGERSHDHFQFSSLSTRLNDHKEVPSVLKPRDAFQDLSNTSEHSSAPMTPPMSPNNSVTEAQHTSSVEFTPFVSGKLIQTVKQDAHKAGLYGHRKTSSFKALQIKNLLENRDILSIDSKSNRGRFKVGKIVPSSASSSISGSSISSSNGLSRSRVNIFNAARQLAMHLDHEVRHSTSPSPIRPTVIPARSTTSPVVINQTMPTSIPRSRSISPARPTTPPSSSSKYHRFALDSPQSPVVTTINKNFSGSTKSSLVRRRSSGSSNSNAVRKCVSCHAIDSPCWRPSWSGKRQDQLCNSCGLRYKKTHTRCLNENCRKIPTKGELSIMKSNGIFKRKNPDNTITECYRCLFCNHFTETTELTEKTRHIHEEPHKHEITQE